MDVAAREQAQPSLLRDMVMLTKPRIISLLLVTTIAPMFVAGNPGWLLVLVVLVGGYLMAGGANAVNMYLDRDIDMQMSRTRLRPIPSGRMGPRSVLAFGVALATAATFLLARFTNVLTALLALGGFYFYIFVYTGWLKRTTPQNIVIGGAAGAFPPLVGWASMTGTIDLTAVYLFLIIFYWTPPHFWALALLRRPTSGRWRCSSRETTGGREFRWRRSCGVSARRCGRCCGTTSFSSRSRCCHSPSARSASFISSRPSYSARFYWRESFASAGAQTGRNRRGGCTSFRCSTSRSFFWRW